MRDFTVGNLIKSYRTRLGIKLAEVTDFEHPPSLPVAPRTYQGWELGERIPSNKWLHRIAGFFYLTDAEADELYRAAAQVAPEIDNLPFRQNHLFTGRKTYLERLDQLLKESGSVALTQPISISGLGGIGKTQLALAYAYRNHPQVYRTILWANAADKAALEASYLSLARLLNLPEKDEREIDLIVQAVMTWLKEHAGWLLILDNADDLQLASSFLPTKDRGHILLTTRSQNVGHIAVQIEVEAMEQEEGLLFLLLRSGALKQRSELDTIASNTSNSAMQLVQALEGHPLALDQAGAYIEETGTSFASYIQLYSDQRLVLLNERGSLGNQHPETVAVTFQISFQRACERYPLAADVLRLCSFLHPDAIPEELLSQGLKLNTIAFDRAIAALRHYSLIKRHTEEKILSIHRLVQAILQDTIAEQERKRWAEQAIQTVNAAMRDIETKPSSRPTTLRAWSHYRERYLPHLEACAKLIKLWEVESYEAAELLDEFAHHLSFSASRFSPDELIEALGNTISMWGKVRGPDDLHIADCFKLLIMQYMWQNRYDKVRELAKRISIIEQHTDPAILNTFPFRVTIMSGLTPPDQLGS